MIVLDYLRPLENNTLVVPPFHSGHLGFVPDTEVFVGMIADHVTGESPCELIITPFDPSPYMTKLVCTMRDEPGVVGRLVRAVSKLGINIVTQESSSLHRLKYHRVNMILNWKTTSFEDPNKLSSLADQIRYRKFVGAVPTHLHYYLILFESIIEHCGDFLWFNKFGQDPMPALSLTPLSNWTGSLAQLQFEDRVPLQRSKKFRVNIPLPKETLAALNQRLKLPSKEKPYYLLASDTESKTLRAFFPTLEGRKRLVHLGFSHQDEPGALAVLLEMIRRANFFVVTSLLRQSKQKRNSWEVILEYRGKDEPPPRPGKKNEPPRRPGKELLVGISEHLCRWAVDKFAIAVQGMPPRARHMLSTINVEVGLPEYPRPIKKKQKIPLHLSSKAQQPVSSARSVVTSVVPPEYAKEAEALKKIMKDARSSRQRPKVFLSYSAAGAKAADYLDKKLFNEAEIITYHDHDGNPIVKEAVERIRKCDGFIGIWWHEDKAGKRTSAWLPFELGLAIANNIPALIIRSPKLKDEVWKRIELGMAIPVYNSGADTAEVLNAVNNLLRHLTEQGRRPHAKKADQVSRERRPKSGKARQPRTLVGQINRERQRKSRR